MKTWYLINDFHSKAMDYSTIVYSVIELEFCYFKYQNRRRPCSWFLYEGTQRCSVDTTWFSRVDTENAIFVSALQIRIYVTLFTMDADLTAKRWLSCCSCVPRSSSIVTDDSIRKILNSSWLTTISVFTLLLKKYKDFFQRLHTLHHWLCRISETSPVKERLHRQQTCVI